jgi:hypothetical protein
MPRDAHSVLTDTEISPRCSLPAFWLF